MNISPTTFKALNESLYNEIRDTLTDKKLDSNAKLASHIKEPLIFGKIEEKTDFLKTFILLNESTLETRRGGMFLLKKILPALASKENLLDVGPGDGKLTQWVGNHFRQVTILDVNKEIIDSFNVSKRILRKTVKLRKIYGDINSVQLPSSFYDLILLSHVLYYLPRDKWLATIKKTFQSLKRGGVVLVTLSGDEFGKADLIDYYGGKRLEIHDLLKECVHTFGHESVQAYFSKESIITRGLDAMLHIAGFCLNDANVTATKVSLSEYINKHFKKEDNLFEMTSKQNFILIHKN